jgi:uncharacterized protein (DUF362 family)/Pyruvate/2-oxoacid:ferredoxin oxidoreductase delta subunit
MEVLLSTVALVRCEGYAFDDVRRAVEKGVGLLGGPSLFAKPGEKILFKPNWLVADPPERLTATNPMVFKAMVSLFRTTGAKLSYGDSPAMQSPEFAAKMTGFLPIAEAEGVTLADFKQGREIAFSEGIQNKRFVIANGVLESDGIISLPKLKTHGLERVTGCVKNQFGCVPGTLKGEFHVKLASAIDFARMLVDLNAFVKPRLYVMDGIVAMEGNGPRGGAARPMNVLLFSTDPIALDATVCRMIDIDPEFVPTITLGMQAKTGTWRKEDIALVGDPFESFVNKGFDVKREPVQPYSRGKGSNLLRNAIVPRPYILEEKCTRCGTCVKACPVDPKAVDWHDGKRNVAPSYRYERCIRCYCCQELCPEGAVELNVPFLKKLLGKKRRANTSRNAVAAHREKAPRVGESGVAPSE